MPRASAVRAFRGLFCCLGRPICQPFDIAWNAPLSRRMDQNTRFALQESLGFA